MRSGLSGQSGSILSVGGDRCLRLRALVHGIHTLPTLQGTHVAHHAAQISVPSTSVGLVPLCLSGDTVACVRVCRVSLVLFDVSGETVAYVCEPCRVACPRSEPSKEPMLRTMRLRSLFPARAVLALRMLESACLLEGGGKHVTPHESRSSRRSRKIDGWCFTCVTLFVSIKV